MKKNSLFVLLVILAVSLESCSLFGSKDGENTASNPSPNPPANNSQPTQTETTKVEVNRVVGVGGLIPATNPNVRVSGSVRGRQDPFAVIAIQPKITTKPTEGEQTTKAATTSQSQSSKAVSSNSSTIKSTPTINSSKRQPVASLAQDVIISGLVKLEGTTKLIVKEPGEALSRYVNVGQYISDGKILVKQIISENRSTPEVILVENGVEITKKIGEKPIEQATPPSPQAINPAATLPSSSVSWVSNYLSQKN